MKIYNLHSKDSKDVKDIKVISHEEYSKNGKLVENRYVQFTIIGNNRSWEDFMPIKDFKKLNPKVKVKGLS